MKGRCFVRVQTIGQGLGTIWLAYPAVVTASLVSAGPGHCGHAACPGAHKDRSRLAGGIRPGPAVEFNQLVIHNHEVAMAELHRQYVKAIHRRLDENHRQWRTSSTGNTDLVSTPAPARPSRARRRATSTWEGRRRYPRQPDRLRAESQPDAAEAVLSVCSERPLSRNLGNRAVRCSGTPPGMAVRGLTGASAQWQGERHLTSASCCVKVTVNLTNPVSRLPRTT